MGMTETDFQQELKAESEAVSRYMAAVQEIVAVAPILGHWGDGNCGSIMLGIERALRKAGYWKDETREPSPQTPAPVSRQLRKRVFERDRYRCVACGDHIDLTVDHKIPRYHGGTNDFDNLQTMCKPCNSSKGARLEVIEV